MTTIPLSLSDAVANDQRQPQPQVAANGQRQRQRQPQPQPQNLAQALHAYLTGLGNQQMRHQRYHQVWYRLTGAGTIPEALGRCQAGNVRIPGLHVLSQEDIRECRGVIADLLGPGFRVFFRVDHGSLRYEIRLAQEVTASNAALQAFLAQAAEQARAATHARQAARTGWGPVDA